MRLPFLGFSEQLSMLVLVYRLVRILQVANPRREQVILLVVADDEDVVEAHHFYERTVFGEHVEVEQA